MNVILEKEFLIENSYVQKKTMAVYDSQFWKALKTLPWQEWFNEQNPFRCRPEYLAYYDQWIGTSKRNEIHGLKNFPIKHLINGTTQTFDEAYYQHSHRRLRIFKGEYAYHKRAFANWSFIESEPLSKSDFIIISAPFCSTGEKHPRMDEVLNEAYELEIPVLVDAAYFGTCTDLKIDLSHPSIESVSFSLTKGTGLGDIRSGIRYSKEKNNLPIAQQNDYDHTILAAARIGLYMMEKFSPDYIPDTYRDIQVEVCKMAQVQPTNCMHLALGGEAWNDFMIDGAYNRLGIRELVRAKKAGVI